MIPGDAVSPAMLAGIGLLAVGIGVLLICAVGLAGGGARPTTGGRHRTSLAEADTQHLPVVTAAPADPGMSITESGALILDSHRVAEQARAEAIRRTRTLRVPPYVPGRHTAEVSAA